MEIVNMRTYKVYITQHYEPIIIKAESSEKAEQEVRENYVWGEPIEADILAVGTFQSQPVNGEVRNKKQKL